MERFDAEAAHRRLRRAWSAATGGRWRADGPALGQCSVMALPLRDRYGAELPGAPTPWGPHFYNRIDGARVDLTAERFVAMCEAVPPYLDRSANRAEAMADTTPERYAALIRAFDAAQT